MFFVIYLFTLVSLHQPCIKHSTNSWPAAFSWVCLFCDFSVFFYFSCLPPVLSHCWLGTRRASGLWKLSDGVLVWLSGVNSLPKTVTRQRRDCDLNPGPSAPESSTLTTRLPSKVQIVCIWSSWCHCHIQTPYALASFKSRLVLHFWYRQMCRVISVWCDCWCI